jgi:hypothetical protein
MTIEDLEKAERDDPQKDEVEQIHQHEGEKEKEE